MGIKVRPPLFQACSLYHILSAIVNSSQGENLPPLPPMKNEGDRPHHPGYSTSAWDCFELRHLKTHKYSKETGRKTALRKLYWFPKSKRNIWKRASLAQLDLGGTLLEQQPSPLPSFLFQLLLAHCFSLFGLVPQHQACHLCQFYPSVGAPVNKRVSMLFSLKSFLGQFNSQAQRETIKEQRLGFTSSIVCVDLISLLYTTAQKCTENFI